MEPVSVDEQGFIRFLMPWLLSGRSIISLPKFEKHSYGIELSIVSIDNTKVITLKTAFPSYASVMGYYGQLVDRLSDF